jgi:hypothetical protein
MGYCAGVAELVDALVLGTSDLGREGSSPFTRTKPLLMQFLSFLLARYQ